MKHDGKRNKSVMHISRSASKSNKHSKRGKKGKDCIYYQDDTQSCNNEMSGYYHQLCHHDYCHGKQYIADDLSHYDDTYIQLPQRASYHDTTNYRESLSQYIGTPAHVGYLRRKDGEPRRHMSRCTHLQKPTKWCKVRKDKCIGSSHCNDYMDPRQ